MDTNAEAGEINHFAFDEDQHRYLLNGSRLSSVTEILKAGGLIDDRFFTEEARNRGTAVHAAVLYDLQGDLGDVHPKIKPYVDSWLAFKAMISIQPILELCEAPLYHPEYLYGGRPDIVCKLNGRYVLIDIKSGGIGCVEYQLAAYRELPEIRRLVAQEDRFSLQLKSDGSLPKLKKHSSEKDFTVFLSALNLSRIKGGNP